MPERESPVEMIDALQYAYFAPHAVHGVTTETQLDALIANDDASIASQLDSYVLAALPAAANDVYELPLTDDGAGTHALSRSRFRLFEVVAYVEALYFAPDFFRMAPPTEQSTLRFSPALRGVVSGDWIAISASQTGFLNNLAVGTVVVVDNPSRGESALEVLERDGRRLRLSGWHADDARDGSDAAIVGVVVRDPSHVLAASAFSAWRGAALANGDDYEIVDVAVGTPAAALGDAVSRGSVAIEGTDSVGRVFVAVYEPASVVSRGMALAYVQFNTPHARAPPTELVPTNASAAALVPQAFADSTTSGFAIRLASPDAAPRAGTVYAFSFVTKTADAPADRRPVKLSEFNEDLYRMLYAPADRRIASMPLEPLFDDYLAHPDRIGCERDLSKLTRRTFDVTVARTALSIASGAVLTFQAPFGGAITGVVGADDVGAGQSVAAGDADRVVPTLAAVTRMLETL
jgi:hypothetical protein